MTVRGGHQGVTCAPGPLPMGGARAPRVQRVNSRSHETGWRGQGWKGNFCQLKAMNPRRNYLLSKNKMLWKYYVLGNVCVTEGSISLLFHLFFLWSFGFLFLRNRIGRIVCGMLHEVALVKLFSIISPQLHLNSKLCPLSLCPNCLEH